MIMNAEKSKLLDRRIIEHRLKILKEGYASCSIEGLDITKGDKEFIEKMVNEGLNPDEMIQEIKKRMAI